MTDGQPGQSLPPILDLHSDFFLRVQDNGVDFGNPPVWTHADLPALEAGAVQDQIFAIFVDPARFPGPRATARALGMIHHFRRAMNAYRNRIAFVGSMAESEAVRREGRIAAWLWLEGGAPLLDEPDLLHALHELGIRGMTLTWTGNLSWAGSGTDPHDPDRGLNELGRRIVRTMNELRMVPDVSHTSERTLLDTIATSSAPVVASHSGCRALCDIPRNLSDLALREIARSGGVAGIVAVPQFLSPAWDPAWDSLAATIAPELDALLEAHGGDTHDPVFRFHRSQRLTALLPPDALVTMRHFLDHICHAAEVAGAEHVALGSDFDGISALPVGMESAACWPAVIGALRGRGFSETEIAAIAGGNARRVLRQTMG